MKRNISFPKPTARPSKNGFDLSRRDVFSTRLGLCTPVLAVETNPNEHFEINVRDLLRTLPVQSDAFSRMKQHIDFVFVPFSQMHSGWNQYMTTRNDETTSLLSDPQLKKNRVYFSLGHLIGHLLLCHICYYVKTTLTDSQIISASSSSVLDWVNHHYYVDIHNFSAAFNAMRYLDHLGYGNYNHFFKEIDNVCLNGWHAASPSDCLKKFCAWIQPSNTDFTAVLEMAQNAKCPAANNASGYDNNRYCYDSTGTDSYVLSSDADALVIKYRYMLKAIGIEFSSEGRQTGTILPNNAAWYYVPCTIYPNAWRIAAFAKAWSDILRDPIHDTNIDPVFNFDLAIYSTGNLNYQTFLNVWYLERLLMPRYARWTSDMFTGAMPSPQYGDVSTVSVGGESEVVDSNDNDLKYTGFLSKLYAVDSYSDVLRNHDDFLSVDQISGQVGSTRGKIDNSSVFPDDDFYQDIRFLLNGLKATVNVLDFKQAEAIQAWRQTTLLAGYRVNDQFLAHYGVTSAFEGKNHAQYLGGTSSDIQISEVLSQADTQSAPLGEIAGKGIAGFTDSDKVKFDSRDFGVIIGIYHISLQPEYSSFGIDKANMLFDRTDYFNEKFQNLGLVPVTQKELSLQHRYNLYESDFAPNDIVGYLPPYYQYKTAIDKVHGEFVVMPTSASEQLGPISQQYDESGVFSQWVSPRWDVQQKFDSLSQFYLNPALTNNIFAQIVRNSIASDVFIVNMFFDIKSIRPMSELGLVQFNV